jgi:hypothetical protein
MVATSIYALLKMNKSTEQPAATQSWPSWLYAWVCGVRTDFSLSVARSLRSSRFFNFPGPSCVGRDEWKTRSFPAQSDACKPIALTQSDTPDKTHFQSLQSRQDRRQENGFCLSGVAEHRGNLLHQGVDHRARLFGGAEEAVEQRHEHLLDVADYQHLRGGEISLTK